LVRPYGLFMNRTVKGKIFSSFAVSVFLGFTLFVFGPSQIYFTNAAEFSYAYSEILKYCLFLFLVAAILSGLILLTLKNDFFEKGVSLLFAISFLLWVQGSIFLWDYGPLDGRLIQWKDFSSYGYIDTAFWLGCLFLALFKSKIVCRFAPKLSIVLILTQLVTISIACYGAPKTSFKGYVFDNSEKFIFSKKRNVIILVLDAFQSDLFHEIINEDEKFRNELDGFIYFRNALAGFAKTYASVPFILTGQYYDNSIPVQEFIKRVYLDDSIPKLLKENGFRVDLFPITNQTMYADERVASNIKKKVLKNYAGPQIFDDASKKQAFLFDLALFRHAPHFVKKFVYNDQTWLLSGLFHAKHNDILFIEEMISSSDAADDIAAFKYYHLNGAHLPIVLNENLEFEQLKPDRNGIRQQAKGMLKLTNLFLNKLKKLGVYDNSLIFIIADHGGGAYPLGLNVQASGYEENTVSQSIHVRIRGAGLPVFLVKPFHSEGELKISDAPVSLGDIAKTIASELQIDQDFPGRSIFDVKEDEERNRRFLFYDFEDDWNHQYLPAMQEYIISGFSWLARSWKTGRQFIPNEKRSERKSTIEKYQTGEPIRFVPNGNAQKYMWKGWADSEKGFIWTNGNMASLFFKLEKEPEKGLILTANLFAFLPGGKIAKQRADIYADDKKVGTWVVTSPGDYKIRIPRRLIKGKIFKLSFSFPDAVSPLDLMLSTDTRKLALGFREMQLTGEKSYKLGSEIDFRQGGNALEFMMEGWSSQEEDFTWTDKKNAIIVLPLEKALRTPHVLKAHLGPYLANGQIERQDVNIYINGRRAGSWQVKSSGSFTMKIPEQFNDDSRMRIRFELPNAASPDSFGLSKDVRNLGVGLQKMEIIASD
jgi:hypothetical protein